MSTDKCNYCLSVFNDNHFQKTLENAICEHLGYVSNANLCKDKCSCYWSCEENTYDTFLTNGMWPPSNRIQNFISNYVQGGSNV